MTTKISANRISKTPNIMDQSPPNKLETSEVANERMANTKTKMIATTNAMTGEYLGKQWVSVILKRPSPTAIINV